MLRKIVTTAAIFLLLTAGHAQNTWIKTYGGTETDRAYDVKQTADGGYIIAGGTASFGKGITDVYLIRSDANGDTLWTRAYGGSKGESGKSVQQMADGGYIVAGSTSSFAAPGRTRIYVIRTDALGDTIWTRTYGGAWFFSLLKEADGGFLLMGGNDKYTLLKRTDANGDTLWTKAIPEIFGTAIAHTSDGNYILACVKGKYTNIPTVMKVDASGNPSWIKECNWSKLSKYDYLNGYSIQETTDGGFIFTGSMQRYTDRSYACLIKTSSTGDTLWTRLCGAPEDFTMGFYAIQTSEGEYLICGSNIPGGRYGDTQRYVYLIKTDASGNQVWDRRHAASQISYGRAVQQTEDGGYVVTGYMVIEGQWLDVCLIKTDESGLVTGVNDYVGQYTNQPQKFNLRQNTPNPFNQSTNISYEIHNNTQNIKLTIFDLTGKEVITLVDEVLSPGIYSVLWNGKDKKGGDAPSGTYFCKLHQEGNTTTVSKKILLIR